MFYITCLILVFRSEIWTYLNNICFNSSEISILFSKYSRSVDYFASLLICVMYMSKGNEGMEFKKTGNIGKKATLSLETKKSNIGKKGIIWNNTQNKYNLKKKHHTQRKAIQIITLEIGHSYTATGNSSYGKNGVLWLCRDELKTQ